jgi:uncharacterized membrane protein
MKYIRPKLIYSPPKIINKFFLLFVIFWYILINVQFDINEFGYFNKLIWSNNTRVIQAPCVCQKGHVN